MIVSGNNSDVEINNEYTLAVEVWKTNDSSIMNQLEIFYGANFSEYEHRSMYWNYSGSDNYRDVIT